MSEDKHRLKERDHHVFAGALHDHLRKNYQVIGAFGLGVSNGAAKAVGAKHHVGVGE